MSEGITATIGADNSELKQGLDDTIKLLNATLEKVNAKLEKSGMAGGQKLQKGLGMGGIAGGVLIAKGVIAGLNLAKAATERIVAGISQSIEKGAALDNISKSSGVAVKDLYVLQNAFKSVGMSTDAVAKHVTRMQQSIAGGKKNDLLQRLGIDPATLRQAAPSKQFEMIGAAIAKINDPAERTAASIDMFGKGAERLIPLFSSGAIGTAAEKFSAEAESLEKGAAQMNSISTLLGDVGEKLQGFYLGMLEVIGDDLERILQGIVQIDLVGLGKDFAHWLGEAFEWIFQIGKKFYSIGDAWDEFVNAGREFFAWIGTKVFEIIDVFSEFFPTMWDLFKSTAFDTIEEIATKIQSSIQWAIEKVIEGISKIPGLNKLLGIEGFKGDSLSKIESDTRQDRKGNWLTTQRDEANFRLSTGANAAPEWVKNLKTGFNEQRLEYNRAGNEARNRKFEKQESIAGLTAQGLMDNILNAIMPGAGMASALADSMPAAPQRWNPHTAIGVMQGGEKFGPEGTSMFDLRTTPQMIKDFAEKPKEGETEAQEDSKNIGDTRVTVQSIFKLLKSSWIGEGATA